MIAADSRCQVTLNILQLYLCPASTKTATLPACIFANGLFAFYSDIKLQAHTEARHPQLRSLCQPVANTVLALSFSTLHFLVDMDRVLKEIASGGVRRLEAHLQETRE